MRGFVRHLVEPFVGGAQQALFEREQLRVDADPVRCILDEPGVRVFAIEQAIGVFRRPARVRVVSLLALDEFEFSRGFPGPERTRPVSSRSGETNLKPQRRRGSGPRCRPA
jgi:hypothetical protein